MRRFGLLTVVSAAALVAGLAAPAAAAPGDPSSPEPPTRKEAIQHAKDSLAKHQRRALAGGRDEFKVYNVSVDGDGSSHVRFTRTYNGLPVLGSGMVIVHNKADGDYLGISRDLEQPLSLSTDPGVSKEQAKETAGQHFEGKLESVKKPRLVVRAVEGNPRLAWEVVATGTAPDGQTPSELHVFVDANNGRVIGDYDEVRRIAGTGHSIYSGTVEISTDRGRGGYVMRDVAHGNGTTINMHNRRWGGSVFTDTNNEWGNGSMSDPDSAAVDAHFGAATTYEYYKNVHGRNGIFGDGRGVPSRVHYGNGYVNAFWDGQQMTYGDGRGNRYPLVSLDVAGHEMTHGVTSAVARLAYEGDAGGLNESTSDIFGTMVEFYANVDEDPGDYLIGEEFKANFGGRPLRWMYDPSTDGRSFNCWNTRVPRSDPHYSSGVGNHFFFLLAQGSENARFPDSPTCNGSTVEGIGRSKAAAIWFKALRDYFLPRETYSDARDDTLQAAADLYGRGGAEYKAVQAAWNAVDVS